MKHRSLLVSFAALVSLCAIAADTTVSIELINDGSTVVTAVDHTRLVNGTTEVRANTNGTASVVYDSIVLHVPPGFKYGGASMTKTGDIEFYGPRVAGGFNALWVPVGESFDSYIEPGSGNLVLVSASLDQPAVVYLCDDLGSFIYSISGWNTDSPSLARCGDSVYSGGDITIGKKVERTMATTDQIPSVPTLATVATSGSYNDLLNKPTNVSAFNNDAGYVDAQTATNIARQIIRSAVANVNVNLQSAEDTRATLTNLITILKNL